MSTYVDLTDQHIQNNLFARLAATHQALGLTSSPTASGTIPAWCKAHISGNHGWDMGSGPIALQFWFDDPRDAVLFKLTWG